MYSLNTDKLDTFINQQENRRLSSAAGLLKIKTVNQWIAEAKEQPDPKMLFGSLWYEGEVCLLFASSNLGKSVLAAQIGEAIARGKTSLPPLCVNSSPRRVLFLDCELSPKQFQLRYTEEGNSPAFSENYLRAEVDKKKLLQGYTMSQLILGAIEDVIQKEKVEVIILDNITALRVDMEKSTEAANLMIGLQQFQEEHAVSILIIAHTPKRPPSHPITDNDLSGSKVLMNLADSAFSIGASQQDSSFRYIKQIKVRNSEKLYGGENVILCEMIKENAFLGFQFVGFDEEQQHLQQKSNGKSQEEELSLVRQLLKDGYSQRQIRDHLEISLGKVNRLCKVSPYLQLSKTFFERLKDASNKGVRVVIVYGKDELKQEERTLLASLKGVELYFFENLHAKCYFNDNSMVITSMNMYEFSLQNNREMGIFLQRELDPVMFKQAVEETSSIIQSAEKKKFEMAIRKVAVQKGSQISSKGKKAPTVKKKNYNSGHCIRCMEGIPYNPERPYCRDCFSTWSVYENYEYEENACHQCGMTEGTSMNKPECYDCYTGGW